MSSRSRAADNLAYHLSSKLGIPVNLAWDNPSGRLGHGVWRVRWTDGPTVATVRADTEHLVRYCRPLTIGMLRVSRFTTRQALAAAMLALARRSELPDLPASAAGLAEAELADTDTAADWAHLWAHAGQLVQQADSDLYEIVTLIHATVTKPCRETDPGTRARHLPALRGAADPQTHRPARPLLRTRMPASRPPRRPRRDETPSRNHLHHLRSRLHASRRRPASPALLTRLPNPSLATLPRAGR